MATVAVVAGSGGPGFAGGPAATGRFNWPSGIAVAPDGGYLVTDYFNNRVRRLAPDGTVSTVAGTGEAGGTDGPGEDATFNCMRGIAVDRRGIVYVTELWGKRVRKIICTGGGWVVSTVVAAGLCGPWGIAVGVDGHLVVADGGLQRVVQVDPATGAITVLAGDGIRGFRDGPGATARFNCLGGVAVGRRGDIFVTDYCGHRVRRISAADHTVTTVAGSGVRGLEDGVGSAAQFNGPASVAVDGRGTLIVVDGDWDDFRLRRIVDGVVTTVPCEMDGGVVPGTTVGIAIDRDGSVLVAVPSTHRILRVTGLGLAPPSALPWSLRAHRGLAAAAPGLHRFVTMMMMCAMRLDDTPLHLPHTLWLAILEMLRPDQMIH